MKAVTYNQKGEKIAETLLPKEIFEICVNHDLIHQVTLSQASNRRQGSAKTKDRSEVRGGGKKPWRQKGTGRARHGSTRSPIWKGGGVTFGPVADKNYKKRIPKKMKKKALFMVLSAKAQDKTILVLDGLKMEKPKTKEMAELLNKLPLKPKSILLALASKNDNIVKATRNIKKICTMQVKDLNALDLLSYKYLVLEKQAIKAIKENI